MNKDTNCSPRQIDVKSFDFYNHLQDEVNAYLAKLKKDVKIITDLRLTTAEMEVETAFLYHSELWYNIKELKMQANEITHGQEDVQHTSNAIQADYLPRLKANYFSNRLAIFMVIATAVNTVVYHKSPAVTSELGTFIMNWTIWIILYMYYVFCEEDDASGLKYKYQAYEYGTHQEGEVISLQKVGLIPDFTTRYNITLTPNNIFKGFTYLRAECLNPISEIFMRFDANDSVLSFYVKFPFIQTPYGVLGYSMPMETDLFAETTPGGP